MTAETGMVASPGPSSLSPALPEAKQYTLTRVVAGLEQKVNEAMEKKADPRLQDMLRNVYANTLFLQKMHPEIDPGSEKEKDFFEKLGKLVDTIVITDVDKACDTCGECNDLIQGYKCDLVADKVDSLTEPILLAQGKAKEVYLLKAEGFEAAHGAHVFIISKEGEKKEAELTYEKMVMRRMEEAINAKGLSAENIALKFKMVYDVQIKGKVPMSVDAASGDLEKQVVEEPAPFPESVQLAAQFLHGLADMHDAGYVQGDLKLDNVLVYKLKDEKGDFVGYRLKITDFGKTREMRPEEHGTYVGNPRFSAPEGRLSQKGEVYSAALVMIRVLEQKVLPKEGMMISLAPKDCKDKSTQSEKRHGIEKFVVQNAKCLQTESTNMRGMFRMIAQRAEALVASVPEDDIKKTEGEVHAYIDALVDALELAPETQNAKAECERLRDLLKIMTDSDPSKRPTAREAYKEMEEIVASISRASLPPKPAFMADLTFQQTTSHPLEGD